MKIGWIGTGVMGSSMAGHLLDAGHELHVFNRTRDKARELLDRGAKWQPSPAAVARECEIVFTMVGYPADVRQVVLAADGVLAGASPGAVLIDCTTSSPTLAVEIAEAARVKNMNSLDAPVSGGDIGARTAALSIMVGGDNASFDRVLPLLKTLGKTVIFHGPAGSGQHAKMVNQILIAASMVALCEGLIYARASGLDPEAVLQSVGGGGGCVLALEQLLPEDVEG
jgi:3-hydroxyisobutyrate dehydrogenase